MDDKKDFVGAVTLAVEVLTALDRALDQALGQVFDRVAREVVYDLYLLQKVDLLLPHSIPSVFARPLKPVTRDLNYIGFLVA